MPRLGPDDPTTKSIDDALASWRQGDVALDAGVFVHVADASQALTDAAAEAGEGLQVIQQTTEGVVVLTQTCDVVRKAVERPFIEVAPLVEVEEDFAHNIERGRYPNYVVVPALRSRRLVAHLDRVMTVEKSILASWTRTPGWTTDDDIRRFALALARKRVRFAFPDDFNDLVKKLQSRIIEKHDRDSEEGRALRALREIRVTASPLWDDPKNVEVFFWFIRKDADKTFEGKTWDTFLESWKKLVPVKGRFSKVEGVVTTLADMSAEEYVHSDPFDLDYLSSRDGGWLRRSRSFGCSLPGMGLVYSPEELAWLETFMRFDGDRLTRVVGAGVDATLRVDAEAERVRRQSGGNLSHDALEFFADESAEAYDLRSTLADLTLLATYHWIERQTKGFVKRLAKKRNLGTDVMSMNAPGLATFLGQQGVAVANLPNHGKIDLLRLFANSWKHNAEVASEQLLNALQLAHPQGGRLAGSLTEQAVREKIAVKFGLAAAATDDLVVEAAVGVGLDYLIALAKALP